MNPADDHRDPDVDAAWRAANRDQPPPALDAAIAAAARRAVGAGPKSAQAPRAWWPVAARGGRRGRRHRHCRNDTPRRGRADADNTGRRRKPRRPRNPRLGKTRCATSAAAPAAAPQPTPSCRVEATRRSTRASPPIRTDASAGRIASAAPGRQTGRSVPASPSDASPAMNAAAPPADKLTAAPASPKARQQTARHRALAPARSKRRHRSRKMSARRHPAPPRVRWPRTARPRPNAAALAKRAQDSAAVQDESQPRTVDEWIRLIRRLKAEGRNDLAAKELAAFRARYQERADALLPADLREDEALSGPR